MAMNGATRQRGSKTVNYNQSFGCGTFVTALKKDSEAKLTLSRDRVNDQIRPCQGRTNVGVMLPNDGDNLFAKRLAAAAIGRTPALARCKSSSTVRSKPIQQTKHPTAL